MINHCFNNGDDAEEHIRKAIRLYELSGQYELALVYKASVWIGKNVAEAARLSKESANRGNAEAQVEKEGVEQGVNRAIHLWRPAATSDHIDGLTDHGVKYNKEQKLLKPIFVNFKYVSMKETCMERRN